MSIRDTYLTCEGVFEQFDELLSAVLVLWLGPGILPGQELYNVHCESLEGLQTFVRRVVT